MDKRDKLERTWRRLQWLLRGFIIRRFNLEAVPCEVKGPCMVISNHVTTWDPLLLAMSFRYKHLHFVASEHIFRLGLVSRLLSALVAPIARRKGSMAADTVMQSLRAIKAGGSVCIFAEGDATWDGVGVDVFPATGKMVRSSGATLVTYRLEGGYLSLPRWSRKLRRGKVRGSAVGIYPPEQLKAMKPQEILAIINRDIYEDAWQRQRTEHREFRAKAPAEHMEQALFLCPKCGRTDGLRGLGDRVKCGCGFETRYTDQGFFDPPEPFETIRDWDIWQFDRLKQGEFVHGTEELFHDDGLVLNGIGARHKQRALTRGRLTQYEDCLRIGDRSFPLRQISSMAMVKASVLLFTAGEEYYEIRSGGFRCLRKYLAVWENSRKEHQL